MAEKTDLIEKMLSEYVWGLCCKDCNGGGWDYENDRKCDKCSGLGVHSWEYGDAKRAILAAIDAVIGDIQPLTHTNARVDIEREAKNKLRQQIHALFEKGE